MKTKSFLIVSGLLFLALSPAVLAAETPSGQLSPQAREAFDKGMTAVEQKEWLVAISHFEQAEKIEGRAPEVLFNLGLAESKVPGRELRAMAWFGAYLGTVGTNGANVEAVRKEITSLEVTVEARLRTLVGQTKDFVAHRVDASKRRVAYRKIAVAQAMTGDCTGAKQTAVLGPDPESAFDENGDRLVGGEKLAPSDDLGAMGETLAQIAMEQAEAGDIEGAKGTLRQIKPVPTRTIEHLNWAIRTLAVRQALAGDFAGAQKTVEAIEDNKAFRDDCLFAISRLKTEGRQFDGYTEFSPDVSCMLMLFKRGGYYGNELLNGELFTDLSGALRAIAAKQDPDQVFDEYVNAILKMAKALKAIRRGGERSVEDLNG